MPSSVSLWCATKNKPVGNDDFSLHLLKELHIVFSYCLALNMISCSFMFPSEKVSCKNLWCHWHQLSYHPWKISNWPWASQNASANLVLKYKQKSKSCWSTVWPTDPHRTNNLEQCTSCSPFSCFHVMYATSSNSDNFHCKEGLEKNFRQHISLVHLSISMTKNYPSKLHKKLSRG